MLSSLWRTPVTPPASPFLIAAHPPIVPNAVAPVVLMTVPLTTRVSDGQAPLRLSTVPKMVRLVAGVPPTGVDGEVGALGSSGDEGVHAVTSMVTRSGSRRTIAGYLVVLTGFAPFVTAERARARTRGTRRIEQPPYRRPPV